MRIMCNGQWLLAALLICAATAAQDKAKPDTSKQAAAKVLAASEAKNAKTLAALAARKKPDPWLVADELCFRGEHDAARAFAAQAARRKDAEKLPAYVESRRGKPANAAAREAFAALRRALRARDRKAALAATEAIDRKSDDVTTVRLLIIRGSLLRSMRRLEESALAFLRAADTAERLGWLSVAAYGFHESGKSEYSRSDWRRALAAWERRLAIEELRVNRAGTAATLANIGIVQSSLGSYAKALQYRRRALKVEEELGDRAGVATNLGGIGLMHYRLGDYAKAIDCHERALKLNEELGNRGGVATNLGNIGIVLDDLGDYAKALDYQERALKLNEELGNRAHVAVILGNIGMLHHRLGDYTRALDYQERALKLKEGLGDRAGVAATLGNIGNIHDRLGNHAKALEHQERALKLEEELGNRVRAARTLGNIGTIHYRVGDYAKALGYHARSLKLAEELGDRAGVAIALGNVGNSHYRLGDYAKALDYQERARGLAAELDALDTEVHNLGRLAVTYLALGKPADAVRAARSGVAKLPLLVEGLAEEQGATARDKWAELFESGVVAGMQLGETAEVSFFLESGRAGALLESLGGRKTLSAALIPAELRALESEARKAVKEAQARRRRARKTRKRQEIAAARAALEAAHAKVLDAVARIQRTEKAAADVAYPAAAGLEEIQATLDRNEALVSYAALSKQAVALVVTRKGARIVDLGKLEAALSLDDPKQPWKEGAARLRKSVVAPLKLGEEITRLLIVPAGALSYIPFSVLVPGREVAYMPSGTTYRVLLDERAKRGDGVLALGDPVYERKAGGLAPLPGTRAEAKALGDEVLLGGDATANGLWAAIARRPRWRAVHLACHGLVNAERPMLSSLALTGSFVAVHDVFRAKIPADLVVLSACETGKGKVYRAEGIVGFTRAFMTAGAPRVVVSLWKVDDDATSALMVKFYELWKSGEMATATALNKAQEFVRSHDKWSHPYYWAAWQLWGLPN